MPGTLRAGERGLAGRGGRRWSAPEGERLDRLPGHIAYWFAWQAFIDGAPLAELSRRAAVARSARLAGGHRPASVQGCPKRNPAAMRRGRSSGIAQEGKPEGWSVTGRWEARRRPDTSTLGQRASPMPVPSPAESFPGRETSRRGVNRGGLDLARRHGARSARNWPRSAGRARAPWGRRPAASCQVACGSRSLARHLGAGSRASAGRKRMARGSATPAEPAVERRMQHRAGVAQPDALAGAVGPAAPAGVDQPAVGLVAPHQIAAACAA